MDKQLFTYFPEGAIEGQVQWKQVPTSKLEILHSQILGQHHQSLSEATTGQASLVAYGYTSNQETIKQELDELDVPHWYDYITRNHGAYTFVPCPFDKREGELIFSAGFLFYNEHGTLYLAAFYAQLALIYESYLNRCKGDPAGFSIELCWTELMKYILNTCIPRLQNKGKKTFVSPPK